MLMSVKRAAKDNI